MNPLRSQPFTPTTVETCDKLNPRDSNKFHYPMNSRIPRRVEQNDDLPSPFPPHPSVRLPANSKPKQMPMGVGVAPRPTRAAPPSYSQESIRQPAAIQESHMMHSPPPIPPQPVKSRDPPHTSRKYNMTQSYVSSVNGEFPTPPTHNSRFPERESHYPEDDDIRPAYPSSKVIPQFEFPPSPGNRATMRTIDSDSTFDPRPKPRRIDPSLRPYDRPKPGEISPASTKAHAMNALSQAIAAGFSTAPPSKPISPVTTEGGRAFSPTMRMPFDDDKESTYTKDEDLGPPELKEAPPLPKIQSNPNSAPKAAPQPTRNITSSPKSEHSTTPMLGLGLGRGLSTKREGSRRPPRLDIDAVREMEARGSTTSLTDLIKRATKLASNLDRGRTASRMGMLNMFGSQEKLGTLAPGKRDSSMSDMLSAFPQPAVGTPRSEWPMSEKGFNGENQKGKYKGHSSNDQRKSARRRICGMSVPCFTIVLIILILLVAAAILIPVFLIVVPRQSKAASVANSAAATSGECQQNYACENDGQSIIMSDACGCVCRGGFIGSHCEKQGSPDACVTQDIRDGSNTYLNATMSSEVQRAFADANTFNIPLNATTILALFSANGSPCEDQSSLVDVNEAELKRKRGAETEPDPFIMLHEFLPPVGVEAPDVVAAPVPATTPTAVLPRHFAHMQPRQDGATEVEGIVFDSRIMEALSFSTVFVNGVAVSTSTSIVRGSSSSTATATASQSSPSASTAPTGTDDGDRTADTATQLRFSRVVVLYILDRGQTLSLASNARAKLNAYFKNFNSQNVVDVGFSTSLNISVDMNAFTVNDGGRVIGGGAIGG